MYNVDDLQSISSNIINRFLIKKVSSVVSISKPIKKINEKYINEHQLKCLSKYIPNGVFSLPDEMDVSVEPIFCTVGVVSQRKGTLRAINYFIENYANLEGAKLYVVGPNPTDSNYAEIDLHYYEECLNAVKKSNGKVVITGKLSKEKVEVIYRSCIAHIFFSEREGLPNVLLESMSFNCVPIVTEIEGVSYDIIDNSKDGYILCGEKLKPVQYEKICDIRIQGLPRSKVQSKFLLSELSIKHTENYREIL
jgi:glycosyltransferase involved in cell wall biosynthesis